MAGRWSASAFRWPGFEFSLRSLIFRWTDLVTSLFPSRWIPQSFLRWPGDYLNLSIVDDVVWSLITACESVALVSMLCFFFVFCGCTL